MQHYYQDIDGKFDHIKIYDYVIDYFSDPSIFIEVGGWTGKSTSYLGVEIINLNKPIKLFSSENFDEDYLDPLLSEDLLKNRRDQFIFERRSHDISIHSICNTTIGVPSNLCKSFHFGEIDFCFISSEHFTEEVDKTIRLWLPKIKSGGIIAGDCFDKPIVSNSVSNRLNGHKLQTYNDSINWIYRKGGPQDFSGLSGISDP